MEFDDMKKIWDTQNNEPLYVLNESALHKRVQMKKQKAGRTTNFTELVGIVVNSIAGGALLSSSLAKERVNIYLFVLAIWMFVTAVYCLIGRIQRIHSNSKFDRTILGDLDQAIATATYQVHYSALMRWNILPISLLIILGLWSGGKPIWIVIGLLIFFFITWYASGWEHSYYKSRKNEVQHLRKLLVNGDSKTL